MQFSIQAEDFRKMVQASEVGYHRIEGHPVMRCLEIVANEGVVSVKATDGHIYAWSTKEALVAEEGGVTVQRHVLEGFCPVIHGTVDVISQNGGVEFRCGPHYISTKGVDYGVVIPESGKAEQSVILRGEDIAVMRLAQKCETANNTANLLVGFVKNRLSVCMATSKIAVAHGEKANRYWCIHAPMLAGLSLKEGDALSAGKRIILDRQQGSYSLPLLQHDVPNRFDAIREFERKCTNTIRVVRAQLAANLQAAIRCTTGLGTFHNVLIEMACEDLRVRASSQPSSVSFTQECEHLAGGMEWGIDLPGDQLVMILESIPAKTVELCYCEGENFFLVMSGQTTVAVARVVLNRGSAHPPPSHA